MHIASTQSQCSILALPALDICLDYGPTGDAPGLARSIPRSEAHVACGNVTGTASKGEMSCLPRHCPWTFSNDKSVLQAQSKRNVRRKMYNLHWRAYVFLPQPGGGLARPHQIML